MKDKKMEDVQAELAKASDEIRHHAEQVAKATGEDPDDVEGAIHNITPFAGTDPSESIERFELAMLQMQVPIILRKYPDTGYMNPWQARAYAARKGNEGSAILMACRMHSNWRERYANDSCARMATKAYVRRVIRWP